MTEQNVLATPPQQIRFDDGRHARAKIGYVLLATEQTVQDDVMRLRPPGVGVHFTRAAIADSITTESLAAQADLLADCAATLLPDGSLDVVCYACTSGSLVIGEERVFAELNRGARPAPAGKPAICSNQAMIWDCLRLAGIDDRFEGYGRLLSEF